MKLRVRYNEVDAMGYVYHANYISYYHTSRTELLRGIRLSDKALEEMGIILPVIELNSTFLKPAFYDDELIITSILTKISGCRLFFSHYIVNQNNEVINKGTTTMAFVDIDHRKPIKIPEDIETKLEKIINDLPAHI